MKLHLGAGSIYLTDGWTNVDLPAPKTFLACERPDLVERWKTTEDRYYARHEDKTLETLAAGPLDQEYVCDRYGSFASLPTSDATVSQLLTRQSFEHLSLTEAIHALDNMRRVLVDGGILRIDVPDHEETLRLLVETESEKTRKFCMRHLLGPRRNQPGGVHMQSYTPDWLRALVESRGFKFAAQEENIHAYPAICMRFVKA